MDWCTRIQQDGPRFSQEPCSLNFYLLNVGRFLVPIHNVSCFIAFYTTNANPTSHSFSKRNFLSTCFLAFFFYHAAVQINTRVFARAKRVALKKGQQSYLLTQLRNIIGFWTETSSQIFDQLHGQQLRT